MGPKSTLSQVGYGIMRTGSEGKYNGEGEGERRRKSIFRMAASTFILAAICSSALLLP
eukprot:CAMPEP_0197540632 /NCGR_PEP_ID=MMETSP1318-20131121/66573_1 /TAXON_ID=552666 /ORGANISM="Partenskyella glossopodia, Strain RCC365" /LENGTH=57 /DNA_ID=CAMNT_0043099695 /DNA_START=1 /DNA_END=171 /DNA_ORIENTATION=-